MCRGFESHRTHSNKSKKLHKVYTYPVLVSHIQYQTSGAEIIFSAQVDIFSLQLRRRRDIWIGKLRTIVGLPAISKTIWFRVPTEYASLTSAADAFFIATYPMAVALNEDLTFDGAISPLLYDQQNKMKALLGFPTARIRVNVKKAQASKIRRQKKYAQFFTLGIDSFHTLLTQKPDALVFVNGFDIPRTQTKFLNEVNARISDVATQTNTTALFATSNLREVSNSVINWEVFFGGALASVGVLLSKKIGHIWMNGSYFSPHEIHGGTPSLDPLWSTESLQFHSTGYAETRLEKVQEMKRTGHFALMLKHLRVCWRNITLLKTTYNCSRCEKCLRTQFALLACGANSQNFLPLQLKAVAEVIVPKISRSQWEAIYALLKKDRHTDPHVLACLEKIIQW